MAKQIIVIDVKNMEVGYVLNHHTYIMSKTLILDDSFLTISDLEGKLSIMSVENNFNKLLLTGLPPMKFIFMN